MSPGGWETFILWGGILTLALSGALACLDKPAICLPRRQNVSKLVIWAGLVIPGLIIVLLVLLVRAPGVGSILLCLLFLGSVAVLGGSER